MSTLKTKIDEGKVLDFLRSNFADDTTSVEIIKEGEGSQAFFFSSYNNQYVIRIHSKKHGFEKDRYAHERFNAESIPVPKTLKLGKLDDNYYYSITERADGKIIDHFEKAEVRRFLPAIIKTLDAIHNFDISDTPLYGGFDSCGKAHHTTWREHLLKLIEDFGGFENKRDDGAFLNKEIVELILDRYKQLVEYAPNIRHLVHGDYGFNNLMSDGAKITGVIDWELSKYGDFLYDTAWLSFWESEIDYADILFKHYNEKNVPVPNYNKRILCYKLHFGLGALNFFSDSGQEKNYNWTKERLLKLL